MVGGLFPPIISVYIWQYNGWILVNIYRYSQLQEGDILAVNCCCSDHLLTEELMAENLSNLDSQSKTLSTGLYFISIRPLPWLTKTIVMNFLLTLP